MSDRRRDRRLVPSGDCNGLFRTLRHVRIREASESELTVLSQTAATLDEHLTLHVVGQRPELQMDVRVVDSRPVMRNGVLRHQWRLAAVNGKAAPAPADMWDVCES